jgi:threonine synthase
VLSTAHPAKFPDAIEAITGARPGLPAHMAHLMSDAERFETLPNSLSAVQDFILKHCRVTTGTSS